MAIRPSIPRESTYVKILHHRPFNMGSPWSCVWNSQILAPAPTTIHHTSSRSEAAPAISCNLRIFTFDELKRATKNFNNNNLLGVGGFGKVFKGRVDFEMCRNSKKIGEEMSVAVKKLNSDSWQGYKEWKGTGMHSQIKENDIRDFEKVVKEGKLYKIRNFLVCINFFTFKTCVHPHMMQFIPRTLIKQISIPDFPNQLFNFVSFEDLHEGRNFNESLLIDVIGRVTSRTSDRVHNHFDSPRRTMELTLEDNTGLTMGCTLWNDFAEHANVYLSRESSKPIILIIQMCWARRYQAPVISCNLRIFTYF